MGLRGSGLCGAIASKVGWSYVKQGWRHARKGAAALAAAALAFAAQADTMKLPFEQLTGAKKLELRCIADEREIQIPVPERWEVKRAVVHLRYTVSANLIPDSSTLTVSMRGQPIAQARLNPQAPEVKLGVLIPTALLEPGYNPMVLSVAEKETVNIPVWLGVGAIAAGLVLLFVRK